MPRQVFKMHLALAIGGCTLAELDERMTEGEFQLWGRYSHAYFLPHRRAELQAAQTAYLIALTMGGAKRSTTLADFVVIPAAAETEPEMDANVGSAMISAATSSRVFRLGQGRKNKG